MVTYSRTTASRLYGFGGHPGRFTIGLPVMIESTPIAPVGLGSAEGTPPHDAHEPMAITAAAFCATSFSTCTPGFPASSRKRPSLLVGIEPSHTSTYLPALSSIAFLRAASAW